MLSSCVFFSVPLSLAHYFCWLWGKRCCWLHLIPLFSVSASQCLIQDCSLVPCGTLDLLIFFVFSFFFHAFAALKILYYVVICCFMCSGWLLIFDQLVLLVHHNQPSHGCLISREFLKCIDLMKRQIYGNQSISLFSWILVICHVVGNT